MKTRIPSLLPLLFAFACTAALAAEPAPAAKPAKVDAVKPAIATPAKPDARTAAGPVKAALGSQQNRMRECNKSATGKKGEERRAFMKSCLSKRKS